MARGGGSAERGPAGPGTSADAALALRRFGSPGGREATALPRSLLPGLGSDGGHRAPDTLKGKITEDSAGCLECFETTLGTHKPNKATGDTGVQMELRLFARELIFCALGDQPDVWQAVDALETVAKSGLCSRSPRFPSLPASV